MAENRVVPKNNADYAKIFVDEQTGKETRLYKQWTSWYALTTNEGTTYVVYWDVLKQDMAFGKPDAMMRANLDIR